MPYISAIHISRFFKFSYCCYINILEKSRSLETNQTKIKEMKIADSVLLSLFMTVNEIWNISHVP